MSDVKFEKQLLHPKWWLTWFGMAVWWLLVQVLPYATQMFLGKLLGLAAMRLAKRRTRIATINIQRCYPDLSASEQHNLIRQAMISVGQGVFESGIAWFWPQWRLKRLYQIEGLDHLHNAAENNQGVIFMGIHFTTIEICAAFINLETSIDGFYQPHKNAVYEYVQRHGRTRHIKISQMIGRKDVRGIVKRLRENRAINYAPDQDYGIKNGVFAPFFGIQTATVTAPTTLKRLGKAQIVPYISGRLANNQG